MMNRQKLISAEQAADYLGVSSRTLANWRCRSWPNVPYIKLGRCIKYSLTDLDIYIQKNSHNSVEG
jgi:DNA-binding transcriptional regulator YiaG